MPSSSAPNPARAFPFQALLCAALLLIAELIAWPFTTFGIADEWSYGKTANVLAQTGNIVYNGWSTAMLGWQLYPAALLIRIFGYSYFICRVSTLAASLLATMLMQRICVRAGLSERNATLTTLALVLSPIYMQLSVTFMTDINGLLALLLCLYACLRALKAASEKRHHRLDLFRLHGQRDRWFCAAAWLARRPRHDPVHALAAATQPQGSLWPAYCLRRLAACSSRGACTGPSSSPTSMASPS